MSSGISSPTLRVGLIKNKAWAILALGNDCKGPIFNDLGYTGKIVRMHDI